MAKRCTRRRKRPVRAGAFPLYYNNIPDRQRRGLALHCSERKSASQIPLRWLRNTAMIAGRDGPTPNDATSHQGVPNMAESKIQPLIRKYEEMARLTKPVCMTSCPEPGGCCAPQYCDLATLRAKEFGVELPEQDHPRLPYMGAEGCVVPPYLRPLCAMHACESHVLTQPEFAKRYLALREIVCILETELGPSWPSHMARKYRE